MKNNSKFKRIIAGFLCAVLSLGALPMSAFAFTAEPGKTCEAFYGHKYTGSDGNTYHSPESYQAIHYDTAGNQTVRSHNGGGARATLWLRDDSGERQVMCIESGVDYGAYENYESVNGKNSAYFQNLPATAQYGIMLASIYGWAPDRAVPVSGCNEDDFSIATQTIYWEYQQLLRVSPASRTTNSFGIDKDTYYNGIKGRPAEKCYNWILEQMQRHATVPSFASNQKQSAQTYTLKYDPVKKNYSLTLTDSNNTLADINFTDSRISVSRSGNKYTFTSNTMIENAVGIKAQKKIAQPMGKFLVWGNVGKQTMCSGAEDPVYFYFNIKTETTGIGHIIKHSEDGVVGGISFTISGNGVNKTVTTKDDGTVDIELMPGVYTVTEQTIDKYVPQNVQRVTIVSGGTSNVTFSNVLKRGDLKVIKSSEDNFVKGVKFHLFGTSLSGIPVDEYAVTDKSGVATFSDVLISGSTPYTLEEVDTAIRYVVPPTQTAPVKWKEVTNRSVDNILKKFAVTVTKSDYEEGTAQGDATLAGAVYGIYKGDTLIDEYVTDENGQFTTKEYICDTDWTIREIKPSEGYLLDDTVHAVGADPKLYTVEHNLTSNDVTEEVIKGNIALIKHTDDGDTQIETPEEGATFEIYLKSAGSFEAADADERDTIVCDENGFGQTKDMPYGVYTVYKTSGWEGRELMKDFDVFIAQDEATYRYLMNNANFESYIADRKQLLNGNEFILGVSGGGKSFAAKNEIINLILSSDADVIIIDPEREYSPLVKAMGGQIINISATSPNHINAMDMNKEYGDGANPVILKSEFIMSLCEQLIGGNNLGAKQKSIIDRCTASVYRTYQQNDYQGTVPTLQDFRDELLKQDEPEAKEIALAIELFTHGSLNTFAKPTNVDTNSYLICYDILDLGKQLMPIGMLVVLDSILNRITQNRAKGKKTFIFIDEIYLLFQHEYSANFLFTLWKRVRKYGAYASGITQNVDDLLQSHTARTMLANSEFIIMLNQAATDRIELAKLLNISDLQMSYITNVEAGHGLIKVGSSLVPFVNKFPTNTQLYKLMTTKPGEGV